MNFNHILIKLLGLSNFKEFKQAQGIIEVKSVIWQKVREVKQYVQELHYDNYKNLL